MKEEFLLGQGQILKFEVNDEVCGIVINVGVWCTLMEMLQKHAQQQ
jgi:hypothetical protein